MASNTPNLNLYKKDPIADGNDTFNVGTMLNENWDKIDAAHAAHLAETVQNGVHGINEVQGETTFASTSGRTVSHSLGHTNYIVNVVPIQDTGGDLGDVFISKASNAFTIYNTGGFTGSFRYQLMT